MIIVCGNFFNSTWKLFLIRIQNLQISQNKSVIWKIHYVENIIFVAEVHEDQSLTVYGASFFYWTWKSKLQTLELQNYQNFFQKKSAILKICHIDRTWKSFLIPKLYWISQNFRKNLPFWEFPTHSRGTWWLKILLRP